jgi:hypothetical protein
VLGIDPAWDIVTRYGHEFRSQFVFINFSTDWPQHTLQRLIGEHAAQPYVDAHLTNHHSNNRPIRYITGMGHGVYNTFAGYENRPIWSASQQLAQLRGTLVHLLSCQTGALLGRSMVQQGVEAFWGYTVNFSFYHTNPPPAHLEQDTIAERFLRMDCIIDRGILSGRTADQIYDSITRYCAEVYPQLPQHQRAVLLDNYLHLVCPATTWGSIGSTI